MVRVGDLRIIVWSRVFFGFLVRTHPVVVLLSRRSITVDVSVVHGPFDKRDSGARAYGR